MEQRGRESELDDRNSELTQSGKNKEKRMKRVKKACMINEIPDGEERKKGAENLFKEIIADDFPNPER